MFNIPEDHNETTGNYVAIDINRLNQEEESMQLRVNGMKKLNQGGRRKSKRIVEISSGEDTPFREVKKKISSKNETLSYNMKSVNVNRVSEITPSSGMDYFDGMIESNSGFSEMAQTQQKFQMQHRNVMRGKSTNNANNNTSVKKKRKARKEQTDGELYLNIDSHKK